MVKLLVAIAVGYFDTSDHVLRGNMFQYCSPELVKPYSKEHMHVILFLPNHCNVCHFQVWRLKKKRGQIFCAGLAF